ncbi:MAG: YfhO family protein [Parabacteroides sp.]|nr:YfhO family protein [Parabacteroides sp.]
MKSFIKKSWMHFVALLLFIVLTVTYFSPVQLEGKVLRQGDTQQFEGMSKELVSLNEKESGDIVAWLGSMFSGMPSYQVTVANKPEVHLGIANKILAVFDYSSARIVLVALICFYILMCVMGVSKWLAILGAIAYAFASYNFIILEAGHITKAYVIAYMPLTVAGMFLLFQRKYLWGVALFTFAVATSIRENHLQITYYLVFLCAFIYIGYLYGKVKEKNWGELLKVSLLLLCSVCLAVLPNVDSMYSNWELSKTSTRGATELTISTPEGEKVSSGLDKDYAFAWSYGRGELLTLLVPNAYGGSSAGILGLDSELYKELRNKGAQVGKELRAPTYWGEKAFTSGPVYFGALVCFLFVLGMFVIRNQMKWWLFACSVFFILLALGRNFDSFNSVLFHYLPMYNKFRTVEMALVIPGLIFPLIAVWGIKEIFTGKIDNVHLKKGLIFSLASTGGICLIFWLMPSLFFDFRSTYDAQYQLPDWYYNALLLDRASLVSADALRSLTIILLGASLLFWFYISKDRQKVATMVIIGLSVLMLVDLWTVDRRYLNDSNYITKSQNKEIHKMTVADAEILKDKDASYRVLNLNNPFNETSTSYYHKSIGGYHAAKLRRYQELIDFRLVKEISLLIGSLQKVESVDDLYKIFAQSPSLNMLNTRYIIYNPEQAPLRNPFALGNAWFVDSVKFVDSADEEITALDTLNPLKEAVIDKRFEKELEGFVPQTDSAATIVLAEYRPNRLTYKSNSEKEQLAVFSEVYYQPGWIASIDGKEVPHFRVDWTLRGLLVPAGEHDVVFEFKPKGYITASYVASYSSLVILLLLLIAVGFSVKKIIAESKDCKN